MHVPEGGHLLFDINMKEMTDLLIRPVIVLIHGVRLQSY